MLVSKMLIEFKLKPSKKNSNCKQLQISRRPNASYFFGFKEALTHGICKNSKNKPVGRTKNIGKIQSDF